MGATTSGRGRTAATTDDTVARIASSARQAADTVAGAAGEMAARFPDAATTTREALSEANRLVRASQDDTLKIVGAASVGFATGLLFGGANRVLVMAALVPAALVGAEFMQRQSTLPR